MVFIEREDYEFLLTSAKFCHRIDKYAGVLDLDRALLNAYKSAQNQLDQLLDSGKTVGRGFEYFLARKIRNMKVAFSHLADLCKFNENYTAPIGRYLGIEEEEEDIYFFSEN